MENEVVNYLHHLNISVSEQLCKKRITPARLKKSPEVFTGLLFKQRNVDRVPLEHNFLNGSPHVPVKLTKADNLFCSPCKNELKQAKELLSIYPGQVNLSLHF